MGLPCQWSVKETKLRTVSQPVKHEISWCWCMTPVPVKCKISWGHELRCKKNLFMPWFVYVFCGPQDPTGIMYLVSFIVLILRFFMKCFFQFCKLCSLSNNMQRSKGYNVQDRLILKYCNCCILLKIIYEKTICSRYLIYQFLLFLHSHLKVYSTSCLETSSSLRTLLPISLVIVHMCLWRKECREG